MSELVAFLPVKAFARAKSRLSGSLSDDAREALARRLFARTVDVLEQTPGVSRVLVGTASAEVREAAEARGVEVLLDPPRAASLAEVVAHALEALSHRGVDAVLVCMGDLPLLTPAIVGRVLSALDAADAVAVPDHRRRGTNLLALRLPARVTPRFGDPDSLAQHRLLAELGGAALALLEEPDAALDLDTADDLARLAERAPEVAAALASAEG